MVLLEWEADPARGEEATTVWYLLDPKKWNANGDGHTAWRYHPEQLPGATIQRWPYGLAMQEAQERKRKAVHAV